MTSPLRKLPDFVIIGAAKSGTTSLYDFMTKHPRIEPAYTKEPFYFSSPERLSLLYYKTNFPILTKQLTGEASTGYLSSLEAPARMKTVIPDAKMIAILRNPVDRAYSHYHFAHGRNVETSATFEEALELEESRRKEYVETVSELKSVFYGRGVLSGQRDFVALAGAYSPSPWHMACRPGSCARHVHYRNIRLVFCGPLTLACSFRTCCGRARGEGRGGWERCGRSLVGLACSLQRASPASISLCVIV